MRYLRYLAIMSLILVLAACGRQLPEDEEPTEAPPIANPVPTTEASETEDTEDTAETDDTDQAEDGDTADESEADAAEEIVDTGDSDEGEAAAASVHPIVQQVNQANVNNGETLFNQMNDTGFACSTCHNVDSEVQLVGPGLLNIPARSVERVPDQPPELYLYNSIVNPNAYVVEGFAENLMPQNYEDIYSTSEIYDIVAYVMTMGDQPPEQPQVAAQPTEAADAEDTEEMTEEAGAVAEMTEEAVVMDDIEAEVEVTEEAVVEVTEEVVAEAEVTEEPMDEMEAEVEVTEEVVVVDDMEAEVPVVTPVAMDEPVQVMDGEGIPVFGEYLYTQPLNGDMSCADCHYTDSTDTLTASGLLNIASRVADDAAGMPIPDYLYSVIISSSVHGELPEDYAEVLSESELFDIVAYLISLQGE